MSQTQSPQGPQARMMWRLGEGGGVDSRRSQQRLRRRRLVVTQKRSAAAERRRHDEAEAQRQQGWASSKDDGELRLLHGREAQGANAVPSAVKGTIDNGPERERGRRWRISRRRRIWRRDLEKRRVFEWGCTMRPTYMT
ncbi:hypothetical protein PIB30_063893 [Stylosanthes scabra]|uniref:Uncharacterized protein n=1 Tax=Stylosanthes scabra TaxID=79078 RepID=A0ABU6YJ28_9FABA|nr:hypothetical protein [Stylosanthes scabra]